MDYLMLIKALILGLVEGLTEFLPISSTGHLILVGDLLNFNDERGKAFEVIIQFGAILAVCWEYRQRLKDSLTGFRTSAKSRRFVLNVIAAFIPALALGFLFAKHIKAVLFSLVTVALALIGGGLIIFWVEKNQSKREQLGQSDSTRIQSVDDLTLFDAFKIGLAQCAALIPGTSRSGATIIGGMVFGLPRSVATEFSFFLAIPVISAATAYELVKLVTSTSSSGISSMDFLPTLAIGFIAAFLSAFFCIRWLIHYVAHHNFIIFAWYRIIFGLLVLFTSYTGLVAWTS